VITCLITRTQPGAQVTEVLLRDVGLRPYCVPAATIVATGAAVDVSGVQALLMTSAAAARAITLDATLRPLPVYAVGDATAEAAIQAGFTNVISAGGDGAALAVLAADRMKTDHGALLHLRGQEVAGDVTGMLSACGFETRFVEVYHTQDHPDFRKAILDHVRTKSGIILIHSPAGARRLCAALQGTEVDLGNWDIAALSPACLVPAQNQGFNTLFTADQPDEVALIQAVRQLVAQSSP
jgi:uroporphyrinogen-III synthase